jgi:hypothetical protein
MPAVTWDAAAEPLHPEIEWDAASYALWPDTEVTRGKQEVHGARGGVPLNRLPSGPGGPWTNMCSIC